MAISNTDLEKIIASNFPNADFKIKDTAGDQNHYYLEISDPSFAGHSLIDQHKMVKRALSAAIDSNKLHAISIKTFSN